MDLSNDLISQFAKLTTGDKDKNKETTVYGTVKIYDGKTCVKLDGSDLLTPVDTTTEVKEGQRVAVLVKNHSAVIMGNTSDPSAGLSTTDGITEDVNYFRTLTANNFTATNATIENLKANKANVVDLNATNATINDLKASKANITDLNALNAEINNLSSNFATIEQLNATNANIDTLEANVADINTLVGGNLTMNNIQSLVLTTSKVTVDNAFIKDAMIDRVSASKLTAGSINTSLINIGSADGAMSITGSLQQFKDVNGNVRIQIGKDSTGDFTFALYGADGKGQLINQNGITASAIGEGLIVNNMVAENAAIAGSKLDIDSVITEINGSSTTIKSSKVIFDDGGQTLDVAFNQLKTDIEEGTVPDSVLEQINTNTTSIGVIQGEINTLISNTTITKENGETVQMKDDYSAFKITVDGMSSKIGSLETTSQQTSSKLSTMEQTLNGFETELSEVSTTATQTSSKLSTVEQTLNSYGVRISNTETTNNTLSQDVASLKLTDEKFEVEIAKKTDKTSIISTINASTEGITISSSKINITGFVTFSDLSRSGSTTIHGDNIISGTINADKITGGTLTAMDKICFENGVTITANNGETEHGLVMSAGEYVFGGAKNGFFEGVWWVDKLDVSNLGIDNYLGTTINMKKPISVSGSISGSSLSVTDTIEGSVLIVNDTLQLRNTNIWTPTGSAYRDYLKLSNMILTYDSSNASLYVLNNSGEYIPVRASRFQATGDVVCNSVWASTKVYANNVALSSDKRLKTDIRYVNIDPQSIGESGLMSPNVHITTKDMLEFIETIPFASYRMKNEVEKDIDYTYYGFIAQDLLETKVGSELIEYSEVIVENKSYDDEGRELIEHTTEERLRYSENKFIAFLAGAVQEDIKQRKAADKELMDMLNAIINE